MDFKDWRVWGLSYATSTFLYLLTLGLVPLGLSLAWLAPWSLYAFLALSVVSAAMLAAVATRVVALSPVFVVVSALMCLHFGLLSSLPFTALAVSTAIPFAMAYARLRSAARVSSHRRAIYLGDAVILALFATDLLLGVLTAALSNEVLTRVSGVIVALYGSIGAGLALYDMLSAYASTRIEPYSTKWFVALWLRSNALRRVAEAYTEKLRNLIERAGVTEAPLVLATRTLTATFLVLALAPATLCLSTLSTSLALAAFLATIGSSIIVPIAPFLWLSSKVGDRRRQVEDELPWFVLLAAILQRVGIPLHYAFKRLIGKSILPAMEREAKVLNKYVRLLGLDAISALEELARKHPSREFRNLVLGYTSILRTGGDLAAYLESKLFEQLRLLTMKLRRFADTAVGTGELLLVFYLIFASVLAVAGSGASDVAQLFTFVGAPTIAVALVGYINAVQPKTTFRYFIETNHVAPAMAVAAVAILAILGGLRGWLALSLTFLALGAGYGVQYTYALSKARALERQLIDFLHDVTEFRKIGLPPSQAVQRIAKSRSYGEPLDTIVRSLAHQLALAIPLAEAVERVYLPSWLAKFAFFVLGEIEASGGGSIRVLEMLTNFIEEYYLARKEASAKLRVYEIIMMLSPIILGAIVSASVAMAEVLSRTAVAASRMPLPIWVPSPSAAEQLKLLVVASAASMAVVASKAIDGSLRSLLRLAMVAILLTIYGLWLDPLTQRFVEHLLTASSSTGG